MTTWTDGTSGGRLASQLETRLEQPFVDTAWFGSDAIGVQQAIDAAGAAGGGTVLSHARIYTLNDEITYPPNVSFRGMGRQASIWHWPTDLGAGTWGLQPNQPTNDPTYWQCRIAGMGFRGPSYGASQTMGTQATAMQGVRFGRRCYLWDSAIGGYGRGLGFSADHSYAAYSEVSGNHFNLSWLSNPAAFGDVYLDNLLMDGASMAGIEVQGGNLITDSRLFRCSMGRCPYGIYGPPGRTGSFMVNSVLDATGVEGVGNGFIAGKNTTDSIVRCKILGAANSVDSTYRISGVPYDAMIECGSMSNCTIDASRCFPISELWVQAPVYVTGSGGIGDTTFTDMNVDLLDYLHSISSPFIWPPLNQRPIGVSFTTDRSSSGLFVQASAAIAKGDLIRLQSDAYHGQAWSAAGQIPIGIARHDTNSGDIAAVITEGPTGDLAHADATGVAPFKFVKPSATTGRLAQATDFSDGPIIGICQSGPGTPNATFDLHVRLGRWTSGI